MPDPDPRRKIEAALTAMHAAVALLEAELESVATHPAHDQLLSAAEARERYGLGHEAIRAAATRGELMVSRGARDKLLVLESELRRYIASRPYRPTPRRAQAPESLDAWDAEADRSLHMVRARR